MKAAQAAESVGWKIVRQLGEGGQADVSLCARRDAPDGPQYVFKLLKDRSGEIARRRFRQELEVISGLDHPGIVKVIEHAKHDEGVQYYVMEYVPGLDSLRKRMSRNTNPFFRDPLKAIDGFIQLVSALRACEKRRVVHRDLSPANVLVADDGTVKLIDFGLCHMDDGETITLTEDAVGTPHYRAPECSGHTMIDPDIRCDPYSAGKLLWSMVTNKSAFDREQPVFNNLSLSRVLPDVPMSWHFHHVFELTIRQSASNRFTSTDDAIGCANEIKRLITRGYKPLEQLADMLCPQCGLGRFDGTKAAIASLEPLFQQFRERMEPFRGFVAICPVCFHIEFAAKEALQKVLADRRVLA